jgi:hypothetical protein
MSKLSSSASIGARSALILGITTLAIALVRIALDRALDGRQNTHWAELFKLVATLAGGWFLAMLLFTYVKLHASKPAEQILMAGPPSFDESIPALSGFVAMEYYGLILNRTFLVFIAPEGLYGWKAEGTVTASRPTYFQPYADMLTDPDLMRDPEAIRRLSQLRGGFFIPRSEIVAADVIYGRKWGMAGIPHSGRINLRLSSGKSREFILLGSVSVESIQQSILGRPTSKTADSRAFSH